MANKLMGGRPQTQIQAVQFKDVHGLLADLEELLGQPNSEEVHLAMIPQQDGSVVAQGTVVHPAVPAPRPLMEVLADED